MAMAAMLKDTASRASGLKLAVMGFLVFWAPYTFVWLIQKPEYRRAFRRWLTGWSIAWCSCAIFFFVVNFTTGDQPKAS
jgi:hypothetical protein